MKETIISLLGKTENGKTITVPWKLFGDEEGNHYPSLVNPAELAITENEDGNYTKRSQSHLYSRRVGEEELYNQDVRGATGYIYEERWVPDGAIGFILTCEVFDIIGNPSFGENEGLSISASMRSPVDDNGIITLGTEKTTHSSRDLILYWYPGIKNAMFAGMESNPSSHDGISARGTIHRTIGLPLGKNRFRFVLSITGSFDAEEGFDCRMQINWLF